MNMIVVDANVWLAALADDSKVGQRCRVALSGESDWVVPCHGPVEVLRSLGKLELAGVISTEKANVLADGVRRTVVRAVAVDQDMLRHVWHLHHNVSAYDAPYLVLAARYGIPFLTRDKRLARAAAQDRVDVRLLSDE